MLKGSAMQAFHRVSRKEYHLADSLASATTAWPTGRGGGRAKEGSSAFVAASELVCGLEDSGTKGDEPSGKRF